ncbi:hypothetical protein DPMN_139809 [Dreissena polymorpha]|uniref:Uncharacterized protein n=1 Tax=Dreissena polymorpha TaxID=45954 RepID=A0A9D4JIF7_DREPO|nr:hypothetical protein DPMN_139809 [Dreissena polymorpha]
MKLLIICVFIWIANNDANPCSVRLTSKLKTVNLGTNITLTCHVCNISKLSRIDYFNNTDKRIASVVLGFPSIVDKHLHALKVTQYGEAISEVDLTIYNFSSSSVGEYKCLIDNVIKSSLSLNYAVAVEYVTLTPTTPTYSVLSNASFAKLKCATSVSRPIPTITWYTNNRMYLNGFSENVELTVNSSSETIGDVTTSTLNITHITAYHGAKFYCNASNGYGEIQSSKLTIDVLTFPTKPQILYNESSVDESISILQNDTLHLQCLSSGNPTPNITWSLPDKTRVPNKFLTMENINVYNQGLFTCTAESTLLPTDLSGLTLSNRTELHVQVFHAPLFPLCLIGNTNVTLNAIRSVNGEPFGIKCTSQSTPPASNYTWILPTGEKQNGQQLRLQFASNETYNLEVTNIMNATFSHQIVIGKFELSFTFDILYSVTELFIFYQDLNPRLINSPSITLVRGRTISLRCYAKANPIASYVWSSNGYTYSNEAYLNTTIIDMTIVQCLAMNTLDPTAREPRTTSSSRNITINVLYAPEKPTVDIHTCGLNRASNEVKVIQGNSVNITCTTNSRPNPTYSWIPGEFGNGDSFVISSVQREHSGSYICKVENEMNTTFDGTIKGQNQFDFQIDVLESVAILPIGNYTVLLNQTMFVTCPYKPGNPAETRFTWFHANSSTIGSYQNLSLPRVQLKDEGFYKCRVNNTMEPTGCSTKEAYKETTFFMDVQYPVQIRSLYAFGLNVTSKITISERQTVKLLCEAEGDPVARLQLTNITNKGNERLLVEANNNTIFATVVKAKCEYDMGVYQCKGKNEHNEIQQVRELEITITCSPRPSPFSPPIATLYRRRNASAILTFTIVANPPPIDASAYVWRKQVVDKWATLHNNSRFQVRVRNDSLQTNLSISQLQIDDFTNYSVRVNNSLGSTEQTFVIRANEQPSVPQQLLAVDTMVTESSLTVQWTPGFNGGEDQWFIIGYKKAADESWTYINVSSTVTQLSIRELVAGTKYDIKMYATNIIGKSDETTVLSVTTQPDISDNGSSPSVGAAVGGSVAGTLVAVILAVLWKYRKAFKRKPGEAAHYDDLFNRQSPANKPVRDTCGNFFS